MITKGTEALGSVHFNKARIDMNPYFDGHRRPPFLSDFQCAVLRYGKEYWWKESGNIYRLTVLILELSSPSQQNYKKTSVANGHLNKEE